MRFLACQRQECKLDFAFPLISHFILKQIKNKHKKSNLILLYKAQIHEILSCVYKKPPIQSLTTIIYFNYIFNK